MYFVKRNGKSIKALNGFFTYEEARAALRSYLRAQKRMGKLTSVGFGYWDAISRNPSKVNANGFKIVRA